MSFHIYTNTVRIKWHIFIDMLFVNDNLLFKIMWYLLGCNILIKIQMFLSLNYDLVILLFSCKL